jgi:hypothetical protein
MLRPAFRLAALLWIIALATSPLPASAEIKPSPKILSEITLDIDHDGRLDRAVIAQDPDSIYADLYIYLGTGAGKLDLARKPAILKRALTTDPILGLASNDKGSLIVRYGRFGSNQFETNLTIVRRGGEFLVAGFSKYWDMRNSMGSCDINFLTGKGVASRGLGKSRPLKARFKPVTLADWSDDKHAKDCNF